MGYELDRLMQQFGVGTPTLTYSGMQMPVKPTDLAAGASAMEKANYDALLAKYNADMPLYTSDQAKYKTYSNDYNSRLANTSLYDSPQFQRGAMSSPGTGAFTDQYSQMYQDVLGRLPDSAGLAYWKGKFGDMISPEEYAQFKQAAGVEIGSQPKTNPIFTPRTVLEQPTYNTPTAAPTLQTVAKTDPYVLPVNTGGNDGSQKSSAWDGMTPEQKAQFYDENPTLQSITLAGQKALSFLGITNPLQAAIARGTASLIGSGLGGSNQFAKEADAQASKTTDLPQGYDTAASRSPPQGYDTAASRSGRGAFDPYAGDSAKDVKGNTSSTAGDFADPSDVFASGGYIGSYAHGGTINTKKVRRFDEGGGVGEGFGYGEGAGAAQGSGMGGFGSSGLGEGLGRGIGPGYEAMALGDYATEADYAAQDRSYMDANAANNALTAQENNMQNAQNLAASSQSVRDRNALSAAQDNYASGVAAIASALGGYGNGNKGGGLGAGPNDNAHDRAKGGYIGGYAHGGAVRHYQAGGDVMSSMAEAERLIKALEGGKLTENEREDAMSRVAEIYRRLDEEPVQAAPESLVTRQVAPEPAPIPESLMVRQVAPESLVTQQVAPRPSGGDLIQPMPESVPVTLRQISQAIAKATPLTALEEAVAIPPTVAEAAPLFRPVDPRLFGETNEVATGRGYSPLDPRLYGETDEVAKGKGYSPLDPRLYGESNEVATGPGYSMPVVARAAPPAVDRTLLNLAAKYAKPGFAPTFAPGSIDPGPDRMALISRIAIENKIANPVVNIRPDYVDDSASRLSMDKPQDTTIPMSPNMVMLQKMLLANQSQTSPYADELRVARAASTAQTKAFNDMLEKAIKGQDDNKPSNAEMYFRLAAAFGAPTKTGNFFESLAEVNKSMAEQAKETRLAGKAGQALRLQLGLEGAKANMAAARDDVTALRALASEEMKEKAAAERELIKEYFKSGEAQSTFGKQAQDEGFTPGTPKYQARVTAISEEALRKTTAGADAAAAAAQASLAAITGARETRLLQEKKFEASEARAKKAATQLSGPELKMKEETSQALVTMRDAYADLVKALKLSANAYDGSLADQALYKPLALAGNKDPKVVNTGVLDNILKLGALSTAATTLKTQISDSDMKMLNQVQGAGAKSREERDAILKAAMVRMENMYLEKKSKLADIVSGKYRIATPAIAEETE